MNILYYVEPWVELQNPNFRYGALKNVILKQIEQIGQRATVKIIVGESVYQTSIDDGISWRNAEACVIQYNELLSVFDSYYDAQNIIYNKSDDDKVSKYAKIFKNVVGEFVPDIIISWESSISHLEKLYPQALALNLMPGMFSRVPFPELTSIDFNGLYKDSSLIKNRERIINYKPTKDETTLVNKIREHFAYRFLTSNNPYKRTDLDPKSQYEKLILVPLQVSGYFAFDENCNFKNQYDYLIKVLSEVPENYGVVVTQYVTHNTKDMAINENNYSYLKKRYPNLIYHNSFNEIDGVSQYLLSITDGVATVSSSIGLQALLWRKPIFVYGRSHLKAFSAGNVRKDYIDNTKITGKYDDALAFMLTHMQPLTHEVVNDADWFYSFLSDAVNKNRNEKNLDVFDLYKPIMGIEKYSQLFIGATKVDVAVKKIQNSSLEESIKKTLVGSAKSLSLVRSSQYKVISFDIFDTLLVRPFLKPVDLFRLMEGKVQELTGGLINDFCSIRALAERNLKDQIEKNDCLDDECSIVQSEELTLEEIYIEISRISNLPLEDLMPVMDAEQEYEMRLLYPRESGILLYLEALRCNKKVIITSDMYLSKSCLEAVLKKNNIVGYSQFYLSSEIGLKKHTGSLFKYLLDDLNIPPEEVLHIGDNTVGDIAKAKEFDISTLWTKRTVDCFYSNEKIKSLFWKGRNNHSVAESIILGITANRFFDNPSQQYYKDCHFNSSAFNFGFMGLGPLFFSFVKWLVEESINDGVKDLYFLSRDGDILKRVYDIVAPAYANAPRSHYIYSSRRSARVASLKTLNDILNHYRSAFHGGTVLQMLEDKFGLDTSLMDENVIKEFGFEDFKSPIKNKQEKENGLNLITFLSDVILNNSKMEREAYLQYLNNQGISKSDKPAIVDIGYAGTMQEAILSLMDIDSIGGYYFMTFIEAKKLYKQGNIVKGFCGDFIKKENSYHPLCKYGLAFEVVFSNTDGSFIKMIKQEDGNILPKFESTVDERVKKLLIPELWSGIFQFSEAVVEKFRDELYDLDFDSDAAIKIYVDFLASPGGRDAGLMEGVTFDDRFAGVNTRYMVPPRELINSKRFNSKNAVWKEGTAVFSRRKDLNGPSVASMNDEILKESIGSEVSVVRPNKVVGAAIKVVSNQKKYEKYLKDPDLFYSDSKWKILRTLAK